MLMAAMMTPKKLLHMVLYLFIMVWRNTLQAKWQIAI